MPESEKFTCIACSVFQPELKALQERGALDVPFHFLDSQLHMKPLELKELLETLVQKLRRQGRRVVLVYGDCYPHMVDQTRAPGVSRTEGINCCQILLGKERYKALLRTGAFLLFSEWTKRWRELITRLAGLDKESTLEMFQELHTKMIYLDTGVCAPPQKELQACSEYFHLPVEVEQVSLEHLLKTVRQALTESLRLA